MAFPQGHCTAAVPAGFWLPYLLSPTTVACLRHADRVTLELDGSRGMLHLVGDACCWPSRRCGELRPASHAGRRCQRRPGTLGRMVRRGEVPPRVLWSWLYSFAGVGCPDREA